MVQILGKGEILKGSDCEIAVVFSTCKQHIDIEQVENFTCDIYTTPGGAAITRSLDGFEIDGEVGITLLQWEELDQLEDGVLRYTLNFDYEGEHIVREMSTMYYLKTPIDYTPKDFVTMDEIEGIVASAITSSASTELIEGLVDEAVSEATSGTSPTVFLRVNGNGSWIQQEEDGSDLKAFVDMVRVDPTKCCTVYIDTYGQQFNGTVEYSKTQVISDVSGITHDGARFTILQPVTSSQAIRYTAHAYADESGTNWFGGRNSNNGWEWVSMPGQGQQGLYVHVDITDPDNPVVDGFGLSTTPVVDGYVEIDDSTPAIVSNIKTFISGVTGMLELREYCNIWCYSGGSVWNQVCVTEPILSNEGSSFVYMEAAFFPAHWERRYLLKMYIDGVRYFNSHSGPIRIYLECIKEEYATEEYVQSAITEATSGLVSEGTMKEYVDAMVPSLEGYATEEYVGGAIDAYNTLAEAYFTTSAETQQMISAATQNFLTSADTQAFITSADTQAFITSADTQDFLTSADTADFLTSADTQNFITSADTSNFAIALTSVNKIWGGSAQAYSALTSYDNDTIYFVEPE